MPQKVCCSNPECGEVLYEGDLLRSLPDIIKNFEGYCPKCNKKLVFSVDKVTIKGTEGGGKNVEKGKTARSGITTPSSTHKGPYKNYKLERYSEMLYSISHLRKYYGMVNISDIETLTRIKDAEQTINILKRLKLVDVVYREDSKDSVKDIIVTNEGNNIREIIDKYNANLKEIRENMPIETYYKMLEIIET